MRSWMLLGVVAWIGGCNSCGAESQNRAPLKARTSVVPTARDPTPDPLRSSTADAWIVTAAFPSSARVSRADGINGLRQAPRRALVRLDRTIEECSGLGGSHLYFRIERGERPAAVAHFGGHGERLPLEAPALAANMNANFGNASDDWFEPGRLYVAAIEPTHVDRYDGWCLHDAPEYDLRVTVLVPVGSIDEGDQLLRSLSR